ncbi:hypothetical protein [Actinocrispum wychmicini]|uniref:Thioesterase domain-containing protein n=1 Tax=Actinocrispum wychmicini TaxID=1213861 RepID=A0A4R2JUC1_9PSEU|nr:hypothetical protein [Actinocrispum wychmicini]TCO60866.1 hypothetical protein EV192_103447 [Actinocrispum wychmicini]
MTTAGPWRVLSDAGVEDIVLVCDFPTQIRPEAGFSHLAPLLDPARTVWEAVPPPAGSEQGWSSDDYLRYWMDALGDVTVGAVLGFCAGCVFAAAVTEQVAERQGRTPRLVVFDPEQPTSGALYAQYHRGAELFGAVLPPDEVVEILGRGQKLLADNDDVQIFGPALSALYAEVGDAAFARVGLDPVRRAELAATFASFVNWVVAADQIDPRPAWASATAVTSQTRGTAADLALREIRLDVAHVDLLRDAGVAGTVSELLSAVPGTVD